MLRAVPAVATTDRDPPLRRRRAGPFAQGIILAHAFSFLGGLVYLTPLVEPERHTEFIGGRVVTRPGSWSDGSHSVGDGWVGSFVETWDATTMAGVSIAAVVVLCFLATRVTRSRGWARAVGFSLLVLAALWIALALDMGTGGSSEGGMIAVTMMICTLSLVAGARACFRVASDREPVGFRPQTLLPGAARGVARGLDVVFLSLPFGLQTILTDVVGGIGTSGSPGERWVSSVRWGSVFLTEVVCIAWLGQTPGKACTWVRVDAVEGGRLPAYRTLLRTALVVGGSVVLWLPHVVPALIRRDRAGLHDLVSGARARWVEETASLSP